MPGDVEVFRIPVGWYEQHDRTDAEVLLKLGFVRLPSGGWACDDPTAIRVAATVCAYSFGWAAPVAETPEGEETEDA